ncbi:MAG: DNA replication/repair protein RecF [Oscillospiraceae bacterium]|nr:DNA replication/repair protein RecF [Oscillospiraceae bacterium]
MRINRLTLQNFRNYEEQSVAFAPDSNVIVGENAQGKTNLLEAIVYLSCGHSNRARADRELIRFGEKETRIVGEIDSRDRLFSIDISLFSERRRHIQINKVPAKRTSELSGVLGTVFFCPEDLTLIRDGAAARRRFMDQSLSQLRPRYAAALSEYNRLYEHKTRILRDSEEHPALRDTLPEFNEGLAIAGAVLIHYRARFCARLAEYAAASHLECSGGRERLNLRYETVKSITDPFAEQGVLIEQLLAHQRAHEQAEYASRLCLSGPHKDDIAVEIGGENARQFSSQGQTRTAALAFKLAERDIYQEITGQSPILLLDDVLSELDPKRQEFVLNRIGGGQVFITCCEEDRLGSLLAGKVLHVENGRVL